MPILQAVNLRHLFGADVILDGASITIEPGERVGLVGRNGAGKSTLFKIIAGMLQPDSGEVNVTRGRRVGYLTQTPNLPEDESLRDAAEGAFAELHALHSELHEVFEQMAMPDADIDGLLRQQERLEARIEAAGGYAVEHKIDAALHGLGFADAQFGVKCKDLSGGQRARLALARLLLESPDGLLLDEPTNHLDINGRLWLESFLCDEYQGAVLVITHDRRMLDNVVTKIYELEEGRLIEYPGNYTKFRKLRSERRLTQFRAWEKQQTVFKQEEKFIQRYKTGQRAKQARGRISKLERAKEKSLEKPLEMETFNVPLPKAPMPGESLIVARNLSKAYDTDDGGRKVLFEGLDLTISRGERWGIVGPNGAGKTTLVRCLLGEQKVDAGTVKLGSNLAIGHFRQVDPPADPDLPVYRHIQKLVVRENPDGELLSEQRARDLAGAFLFSGEDQDKPVGVMSGGEQVRTRLAALLAGARNLLLLDEPTNHLDIPSSERLEEAIANRTGRAGYDGAIILISHDRALLDSACDHLVVLDGNGGAEVFLGDYSEWNAKQHRKDAEAQQAAEAVAKKESQLRKEQNIQREAVAQESRKKNASRTKLERMSTEQLESSIEQVEKRIGAIDAELVEVWSDPKKSTKLGDERGKLAEELGPLEFEWSRRAEAEE